MKPVLKQLFFSPGAEDTGYSKNKPILPSLLTHVAHCVASQHQGPHSGSLALPSSSYSESLGVNLGMNTGSFHFLFKKKKKQRSLVCSWAVSFYPHAFFLNHIPKMASVPIKAKFHIYRTKFTLEQRDV